MTPATDPVDPVFLSYRRSQAEHVALLRQALIEHGVPVWQDVENLGHKPLVESLRKAIQDETSGLVFWLTRDMADSDVIRKVEAPEAFRSLDRGDDYYLVPTLHDGLEYSDIPHILGPHRLEGAMTTHPSLRFGHAEADTGRVAGIVDAVLGERLDALRGMDPFTIGLNTVHSHEKRCGEPLCMDWSHAIGEPAVADEETWSRFVSTIKEVEAAIARHVTGRTVRFRGQATLPSAFVAGHVFHQSSTNHASWRFHRPTEFDSDYNAFPSDKPLEARIRDGEPSSRRGALVVCQREATLEDVYAAERQHTNYAWLAEVRLGDWMVEDASDAMRIARQAQDLHQQANAQFRVRSLDVFLEVPAGVAFLLGQISNVWPPMRVMQFRKRGGERGYTVGPVLE